MESKKYTLRFRRVNRDTFLQIKKGTKKVETRAATKKYKDIKVGDTLVFACEKERFQRKAKRVNYFKSVLAMLKKYKVKDVEPKLSKKDDLEEKYNSYPKYKEKIKKFGLVALELKK
ncbi:hypothetical protein C4553_00265 [Candidatus Parcubacteria bacterium]|nr:MAG: hypothetical protein C4553_00265 [Candidatus Parcubacteria bacterium]